MFMISYYTKVHKCNGSGIFSTKQTMNFNIQTAAMLVFFVFDKNGLTKSCSSFEDLSVYKIQLCHVDWCKFCIHLRSLNVRHFGMVEDTGLKSTASRSTLMA
jgi:Golgi nucleoside diphosphatase